MSRRANPYDNAKAESFMKTYTTRNGYTQRLTTSAQWSLKLITLDRRPSIPRSVVQSQEVTPVAPAPFKQDNRRVDLTTIAK